MQLNKFLKQQYLSILPVAVARKQSKEKECSRHGIIARASRQPEGRIYGSSDKSANTSMQMLFSYLLKDYQEKVLRLQAIKKDANTDALVAADLKYPNKLSRIDWGTDFVDWIGKTYEEVRSLFGEPATSLDNPSKEKPLTVKILYK